MEALDDADVRVEYDDRSEKLGYKMREAQIQKVPYLVVLGKNEEAENTVSYRLHGQKETTTVSFDEFVNLIVKDIKTKGKM